MIPALADDELQFCQAISILLIMSPIHCLKVALSYDPTLEATNCDGIETVIHSIGTTRNPMHTCLLIQTICIITIALIYRKAIVLFPCLNAPQNTTVNLKYLCGMHRLYGNQAELLVLH